MVTDEINSKVVSIVNETLEKAKKIWPYQSYLIKPLIVGWENRSVKTAGLAYRGRDKVTFNPTYVNQEDFWETTIVHEVAHHLQRWLYPTAKQAHGPEFRRIMSLLGKDGRTYHSMVTDEYKEKHPHEYVCPDCQKVFNVSNVIHDRIRIGRLRYCCERRCKQIQKTARYTGTLSNHAIKLKSSLKTQTKEVDLKEIIPQVQPIQKESVTVQPKKVGAATLTDILGLNPHRK